MSDMARNKYFFSDQQSTATRTHQACQQCQPHIETITIGYMA